MLSRGASNASRRPRRAKSSPSVRAEPAFSIEPSCADTEITHQQAVTAANLAFERANERRMAKQGLQAGEVGQDTGKIANTDDGSRLGRRHSVRFAGPTAIPTRNRSITRREAPNHRISHDSYETTMASQQRHNDPSLPAPVKPMTALSQHLGEFGESDTASVPSSYRRLRKAKSMFSPGKVPSAVFSEGTSNGRRHFDRHLVQPSDGFQESFRVPDPRLRRSYSFIRGVTDRLSTGSRQYTTNDTAVQMARDEYLRQLQQQRLKEQPSLLNLSGRRKSQKQFRRTVRSTSTNSYGSAIASPLASIEPPVVKGFGHKARNLSHTLKKKIKRVFKRPLNDEGTLPAQHLEASYPHYRDYALNSDDKELRYPPAPEPDAELLLRVGSRESVISTPIFVDKGPLADSVRSVHSDDDESNGKSRVTSWTDSTAANTINMSQMMERKRLSIIKEDGGPHQPSSSGGQLADIGDGYANFRLPVKQSSAQCVGGPLDAQRIFSALQREIDENNRKATLDDDKRGNDSGSDQRKPWGSISTPRRISSARVVARAALENEPARYPGVKELNSVKFKPTAKVNNEPYPNEGHDVHINDHRDFAESQTDPTPQQIAEMNESGLPLSKRPLREVRSAFFPPSMWFERSNTSPYRRAMYGSIGEGTGPQHDSDFSSRPHSQGPANVSTGRLRNASVTGSDSVYSRSSGGHTPKAARSSLSLEKSEGSGEAGTAVIIMTEASKHGHPARTVGQREVSYTKPSGEWRQFMATQVASLEAYAPRHDIASQVKESGHRRENAQCDGEDVKIGRCLSSDGPPKQPPGVIQGNSNAMKPLKHKASQWMVERLPLTSIRPFSNGSKARHNENIPLIRSLENSRNTSKPENEKRISVNECDSLGGLRQIPSHSPLEKQKNLTDSPTTAHIRWSPERVERLRRLKSSSVTSLRDVPSQTENKSRHSTPASQKNDNLGNEDMNPDSAQTHAGSNQKLVDSFLKGRRKAMRISEESGTDPAFL